jgi:hypothetical protein
MGLKRTPMAPSALAFGAGREVLVGGKDYGSGGVRVLDFDGRRIEKHRGNSKAPEIEGTEVSLPPHIEGTEPIAYRRFQEGVGKSLRAVGVSPQADTPLRERA